MSDERRRWHVVDPAALRWHAWEDDNDDSYVVFDPRSGDTHSLNLLAALALQCLAVRPLNRRELIAEIRRALPDVPTADPSIDPSAALLEKVPELIAEFDAVGLIAPVAE